MSGSVEVQNSSSVLALLGGQKSVTIEAGDVYDWPIVTKEHEEAVLEVLRNRSMSGTDITKKFEAEYAEFIGRKYALGFSTGTASLQTALWAMGVGVGDEVIVPSTTYWASALIAYSLGASVVFADTDPKRRCIDPKDIEKRITERTKVIVPVHLGGMPADMDAIMAIAKKHNLKVLEDCSHAQGTLYKGKMVGTFGDAGAMSLMSGKSFAIGEAGIMLTDDRRIYERAILFGHYARHKEIELEDVKEYSQIPCGGYKYRMHQVSAAFGRVQLKNYPAQIAEIDKAMNYMCDLLEDVPGVDTLRPIDGGNSTRGGWYAPYIGYNSEELGGLSVSRFIAAIKAEGAVGFSAGCSAPLHKHPVFYKMDIYGHGKPTQVANLPDGAVQPSDPLPVAESIGKRTFRIPWFKHCRKDLIENYAAAVKKVADNYKDLLPGDTDTSDVSGYSSFWSRV